MRVCVSACVCECVCVCVCVCVCACVRARARARASVCVRVCLSYCGYISYGSVSYDINANIYFTFVLLFQCVCGGKGRGLRACARAYPSFVVAAVECFCSAVTSVSPDIIRPVLDCLCPRHRLSIGEAAP